MVLSERMDITQIKKRLNKRIEDIQKILCVSKLVTNNSLDTKIGEVKNQIPDDSKVVTNPDKYIITQKFDKLTSEDIAERLKEAKLASKNDIVDFSKQADFDDKLTAVLALLRNSLILLN